jgi:hypothetical protein
MLEEWIKRWWKRSKPVNPKDNINYLIHPAVVEFTVNILREYGARNPSAEGLVYWSGTIRNNKCLVVSAVAPKVQATRHAINTTHESNAMFVEYIREHKLQYISQVHSHPGEWVDHSDVDNTKAAFRSEGLVSIVVPSFGKIGMLPFTKCGVHRYMKGNFSRLGNSYIKKHFKLIGDASIKPLLKDFRNEQ